jgi:hypothetical protein
MGHKALEEIITDSGRMVYIARMEFDSDQRLFTLDLKFDPESDLVDKTLVFHDVQDFEETVSEDEDTTDYMDSIIGLEQDSTHYVLTTDIREITFSSLITPEISPVKI